MSPIFIAAAASRLEEKQKREAKSGKRSKRGRPMRIMLAAFPLFIFPVAIYCVIAFTNGTEADPALLTQMGLSDSSSPLLTVLNGTLLSIPMISSDISWTMTVGDGLLIFAIAILFMEILKSTSTGTATIMNHVFSLLVFIVCMILFLLHPNFATSVFFIITVMALLDVLAGVVVTIVSARRDFGVGEGFGG